jgi:PKD repeat protein
MYGVWKQIDPNINWEYLLIDENSIIQKFDKKKHYQEWKWNYQQEGSLISIFPDNSDCSRTVFSKKNGDTLTITENDRTSQYVCYDTINDTKWSTPEKMDMNIVKDNFCDMLTMHMFTFDSDEDGLYFMEAHIYTWSAESINFLAKPIYGKKPCLVNFDAILPANAEVDSFYWQFGDGGTSAAMYPGHVYDSTGLFDVSLFVTYSDQKTDSIIKTNYIQIE